MIFERKRCDMRNLVYSDKLNFLFRFLITLLSLLIEGCQGPELEQLINGGALSSCLTLLKQIGGDTSQHSSLICHGLKSKGEKHNCLH